MIGADNGNRSQAQGDTREGGAERSVSANRRPYEQERTERQGMGDKCARKHEIQELSETCHVESGGAAGKFSVLPREVSPEAEALGEESAEVIVGGWVWKKKDLEELTAQGPKKPGDDLNPEDDSKAEVQEGVRPSHTLE